MADGPKLVSMVTQVEIGPDSYRQRLQEEVLKPEYLPRDGKTFCNYFVRSVAHWFGYDGFDDMADHENSAYDFYTIMERERNGPTDWMPLLPGSEMSQAVNYANHGRLVVVALAPGADLHGHVCIVAPEMLSESPSWGGPVCQVANVGGLDSEGKPLNFYGWRLSWALPVSDRSRTGMYLFCRSVQPVFS